jgi:class III poly(R)-hydroxyalkanoic acid synthase PhaE subunit
MPQSNQPESAFNGWFNTQQQMVKDWYNFWTASGRNGSAEKPVQPEWEAFFSGLLEPWRSLAQQNMDAWFPQSADITRVTAQQFLAGQEQFLHLMQMMAEAWQSITASATAPEDWQKALAMYTDQLRQQLTSTMNFMQSAQNLAELGQLYAQEMQKFSQPWFAFWLQTPQALGKAAASRNGSSELIALTNLYWDALGQTAGRLIGAPNLGLTRELTQKLDNAVLIWQEHQRASVEYQVLLANALIQSVELFMQRLIALAQTGKAIDSQRQFIELWVEVADAQFIDLFHSDAYAQAQGRMVNSSMALRQQQRELTEVWLRMNDLPTRSDLDEAHHNLFELRKEVKTLKKALGQLQANLPPTQETAARKPQPTKRRSTPRKRAAAKATDKVQKEA